jgi:DNA-binding CsgD family transcriptional regulator
MKAMTDPREKTAKELAEEMGVSVSTITRRYAEPRDDYIARAREREDRALALKEEGYPDKEIADILDTSYYSAIGLIKRARARRDAQLAEQ